MNARYALPRKRDSRRWNGEEMKYIIAAILLETAPAPMPAASIAEIGWEPGEYKMPTLANQPRTNGKDGISRENFKTAYTKPIKVPWARSGDYVAEVHGEPPTHRAEFALRERNQQFVKGDKVYYGISYRPDDSWSKPAKNKIMITQWKRTGGGIPLSTLKLSNNGCRIQFEVWGGGHKAWQLGTMKQNEWTDMQFYFEWAMDDTGLTKVWKNGKLVVEHKGRNMIVDNMGYLKVGLYTQIFNPRTLYIDNVFIGKTLEEVTSSDDEASASPATSPSAWPKKPVVTPLRKARSLRKKGKVILDDTLNRALIDLSSQGALKPISMPLSVTNAKVTLQSVDKNRAPVFRALGSEKDVGIAWEKLTWIDKFNLAVLMMKLKPESADARTVVAMCLEATGDVKRADYFFDKASPESNKKFEHLFENK